MIHGKNVMLGHVSFKKGCVIAAHSHDSEQMIYVLSSSMKVSIPDKEITLSEGDALQIPAGVKNSAVVLEDTLGLNVTPKT